MRLQAARNFSPFDTAARTLALAKWGEPFISFFPVFLQCLRLRPHRPLSRSNVFGRQSQLNAQLKCSHINWYPLIRSPLPLPTGRTIYITLHPHHRIGNISFNVFWTNRSIKSIFSFRISDKISLVPLEKISCDNKLYWSMCDNFSE